MKHSILVVDDEQSVRDAFELTLGDDYDVRTAASGEAGLRAARERRPDLVFLDLKMPGMDGVSTLRELHAQHSDLRIYVVTAFYQEFMAPLNAAVDDGLSFQLAAKPLTPAQIRLIAAAALPAAAS